MDIRNLNNRISNFFESQWRLLADVYRLIEMDKKGIAKAFSLAFVIIYPITYLPTLAQNGINLHAVIDQSPKSLVFTMSFTTMVLLIIIMINYNRLVDKQIIFKKPAFSKLYFTGMVDGLNSVVEEISTFLLGKVGQYYFRIEVTTTEKAPYEIVIIPLIEVEGRMEAIKMLLVEEGFTLHHYLIKQLRANDDQLDDPNFLLAHLEQLNERFQYLEIPPMPRPRALINKT